MTPLLLVAACLLFPLILAATGQVTLQLARCADDRAWAAPLMGSAVWCLAGTFSIMTRTPPWAWYLGLLAAVVGLWIYHRRDLDLGAPELRTYYLTCLFTLGVMCVIPFPGMWLMGGDWMQHFGMARASWEQAFGLSHLARSPAFAAGAILCLPFHPSLAAYQIYVAGTTAAGVLVLVAGARTPAQLARRRWAVACVCLSAFYLVHLQNLWPMWLAAGFFVAAILEALRHRENGENASALLSIFWFGVAIAAHESSALCVPFLFVAFGWPAIRELAHRRVVWAAGIAIMLGTCAGWQLWTVLSYGLAQRVAQNPVVTWDAGQSLPARVALNFVDHVVGLLPTDLRDRWRATPSPRSMAQNADDAYYTAIALSSWMAATLLTIFGPTLWTLRTEIATQLRGVSLRPWGIALALTFTLNCLLLSVAPRYGAAQGGLTQVCLLGLMALVARVFIRAPSVRLRRILWWNLLTGFVPFSLLAGGVLLALHLPHEGRSLLVAKLAAADGDWWTVQHFGMEVLAAKFFPGGFLVFAAGTVALWFGAVRVSGQNVRARHSSRPD